MTDDAAVIAELREQTRWLRVLAVQSLRGILREALRTERERHVYDLSDGQRTVREIADQSGAAIGTISQWWKRWATLGIVAEGGNFPGRMKHLFSAEDLGLDSPPRERTRASS